MRSFCVAIFRFRLSFRAKRVSRHCVHGLRMLAEYLSEGCCCPSPCKSGATDRSAQNEGCKSCWYLINLATSDGFSLLHSAFNSIASSYIDSKFNINPALCCMRAHDSVERSLCYRHIIVKCNRGPLSLPRLAQCLL